LNAKSRKKEKKENEKRRESWWMIKEQPRKPNPQRKEK
jgi:hypothetical protein